LALFLWLSFPADRDLIVEGSETRRKFMDSVISTDSIIYSNSFNIKSNEPTQCFIEIFCIESCFDTDTLYIMSNSTVLLYFRKKKRIYRPVYPYFQHASSSHNGFTRNGSIGMKVIYTKRLIDFITGKH
jgi:hypothetical protein